MSDQDQAIEDARKFLEDILSFFGLNATITASVEEDVIELKKRESFGHFSNLPFPYISIKAERNFFFQIILKLVADQPYIICNDLKKENIQNPNLRKNQS